MGRLIGTSLRPPLVYRFISAADDLPRHLQRQPFGWNLNMMASDPSKSREQVPELPGETLALAPSDDHFAKSLRGFGPLGILAILLILVGNGLFAPLSAILVLAWAWRSHTPWREIGYVRPRSWAGAILVGIVFGIAFKLLMKAIVMPLLGAPPINQAFHYLVGNTAALPGAIYAMIVVAGFGEETVFRGFMFERFGKLFGTGLWARTLIVLLTSVWFGLAHYSLQGLPGVEQATIFGLVFGTIFAVTGRIWMLIIAHAAFDLTALAIIYWNVESKVAQFIFDF
jgi:membrane protease YdiL (CAAX protease family)